MRLAIPAFLIGLSLTTTASFSAEHNSKQLFNDLVQPVLNAKCASCHGAEKQKGKLRIDSYADIMKGGSEGEGVIPGNDQDSSILYRVYLPLEDDEHMPPEDKEQLTEQETALVAFWINSGAKEKGTVADFKPDEKANAAIAHVAANLPKAAAVPVAKADAPKIDPAKQKLIDETIGNIEKSGASLMAIAQDTPQLRFSALNVSKDYSDDQLAALKPVADQIKWMDLARTQVSDKGLAHLSGMKSLTRLHLENTKVTDAGLDHLKGLSNLEYLNLYGTQVTDAGVMKLAGLKNLKKIFLWQSKVTDDGAKKLAAAIPGIDVNTGWKASKVEPVVLAAADTKKPTPPAPAPKKPETKPTPKPEPKPAPKPTTPTPTKPAAKPAPKTPAKPAPVDPMFDKAVAQLQATLAEAEKRAADSKAQFSAAIKAVEEATKKAEALKAKSEKDAKVANETKAALSQLQKAVEANK